MNKVIKFLSGKKTFVVGGLMIALGLLQGNAEMTLEGFGLIAIRLGIAKS